MHGIHMVACKGGGVPLHKVLTINVHDDTTTPWALASETLAPSPPVRSTYHMRSTCHTPVSVSHVEPPEAILIHTWQSLSSRSLASPKDTGLKGAKSLQAVWPHPPILIQHNHCITTTTGYSAP